MASARQFIRSWSGGEIAPELFGRLDDARYQQGAEKLRNFIPRLGGSLQRRPGLDYVRATKDSGSKKSRLIPFVYSTGQAYVVEMGEGYFRFHADGATLLHVTAREVASVDATGNTITFTQPHGFTSNMPVRMFRDLVTPGVIPTGMTGGTTYYAIPVDTHTIQVSASSGPGAAVDLLSTGTLPLWMYEVADCPATYVSSSNVTLEATVLSVDAALDQITFTANHNFTTADAVRVQGSLVGGVGSGTTYYVVVVSPTVISLATSEANALAGTPLVNLTAGAPGTTYVWRTKKVYDGTGLSLSTGDPITFSVSGGTIHGGLVASRVYYAVVYSANEAGVATTEALALANTPDVTFTSLGTGTTRLHRYYEPGDIITNINAPQGFYSCRVEDPQDVTPGSDPDVWHELTLDGVFEIPNDYDESELFDVHYAQSGDIKTLVHPDHPPAELRRSGATEWDWTPIVLNASLDAPTGVSMTPTSGAVNTIVAVTAATPAVFTVNSTIAPFTKHGLAIGEMVYLYEPSGANVGDVATGQFYIVLDTLPPATHQFTLRNVGNGSVVGSTTTTITGSPTVRSSSSTSEIANYYRVTAVDSEGRESAGSGSTGGINNLNQPGAYNTVTWSEVQGAVRYNVYRVRNALWYFIGSTTELSFVDDNISEDASLTLADTDNELGSTGNFYPSAVCYFEGRRVFAGSRGAPQRIWMSNSGLADVFSYHIPVRDDDRVVFDIESTEASTVQHLVPIQHLVGITNATEYRIGGLNTDPITPDNISVRPQSYVGGSSVQPVVVNRTIVFAGFMGSHVWEMGYTANDGYQPADLTLRSPHLFDNYTVADMAWSKSPVPVLWVVSTSGNLLGCTYAPEEQIGGWHVHRTTTADGDSVFESIASIPEGTEYRTYAIVKRVIDGTTVRHIERLGSLYTPGTLAESRHVDGGGQFYGLDTSGTNISVTPASSWAAGATVTVASAAGPIFRLGSTDVGDRISFNYLGRAFQATITAVSTGTSASATLVSAVTDANGTTLVYPTVGSITGISSWGWMRDSLSGLDHLEGEEVQVLADGVLSTKTVSSGAITGISPPALRITYGLPIVSELLTLPILYGSDSYGQARTSAVNEVWLRTSHSESFEVAQAETSDANERVPFDASFDDAVKVARVIPRGRWDETGQLYVYQDQPYPLTLVSMTIKASIGS